MRSHGSLSELIFPVRCLGCRRLGIDICATCRIGWNNHIYRTFGVSQNRSFPIFSSVIYSPIASKILLASKEDGVLAADTLVAASIENSRGYFQKEIGTGHLVPIPSRKKASRRRGRMYINELIEYSGMTPHDLLIHQRAVRDQSTLHADQRAKNLSGAFGIDPTKLLLHDVPVIIVDDLVTTGSTLNEAARALNAAGFRVLGAITACLAKPVR